MLSQWCAFRSCHDRHGRSCRGSRASGWCRLVFDRCANFLENLGAGNAHGVELLGGCPRGGFKGGRVFRDDGGINGVELDAVLLAVGAAFILGTLGQIVGRARQPVDIVEEYLLDVLGQFGPGLCVDGARGISATAVRKFGVVFDDFGKAGDFNAS